VASIGVVLSHEDGALVRAVAEAIEAAPDLYVVSTDARAAATGQVLVAGGASLGAIERAPVPVVALVDGIAGARAALHAGARDLIQWPAESERLAPSIRGAVRAAPVEGSGTLVAVVGARGGAGATTVTALLAGSLGALALDLDPVARTLSSLADGPAATVTPEALTEDAIDALARPLGSGRLLPMAPADGFSARDAAGLVRAARLASPIVVADLDRAESPGRSAVLAAAGLRLVVVSNDTVSVRGARLLIERHPGRWMAVCRPARRLGVPARDLEASVGVPVAAWIARDGALARGMDLGSIGNRAFGRRSVRALARATRDALDSPGAA